MKSWLCSVRQVGLFFSVVGYICSIVTLFIPEWLTSSSGLLENENYLLGLWETCVIQDLGGKVCQSHPSLLILSAEIQVARILMCFSVTAGALGFLVTLTGQTCQRYKGKQGSPSKRNVTISGGVSFFLSGLTTLVSVSYVAHVTVQKFWSSEYPTNMPRWEYGNAMFCGWTGGFLLLIGSLLLFKSQFCFKKSVKESAPFPSKLDLSPKVSFNKMDSI